MSGTALTIRLEGIEEIMARYTCLDFADPSFRPLFAEIGEEVVSQTHERFERGEDPAGEPWEESARVAENGGQVLVDNAILQNSIGYQVRPGSVETGTNVVYAAIHQFSGEDVDMPWIVERAFLPRGVDEITNLSGIVADFMTDAVGGKGAWDA
jgi:phage gpG-like protein